MKNTLRILDPIHDDWRQSMMVTINCGFNIPHVIPAVILICHHVTKSISSNMTLFSIIINNKNSRL